MRQKTRRERKRNGTVEEKNVPRRGSVSICGIRDWQKSEKEPTIEESPPPADPEPELKLAPLEPEPESLKEEPTFGPFAGLSKAQKKKLERKVKKEARVREEKVAELTRHTEEAEAGRIRLEEEDAAAAAAAAAEAEKKEDDGWYYWDS
ncbi:hypothetical protein N0V95_006363 [Ascochyta clinopodiicola]|nr:hypothetical protein N0V95_006363 [Ascochyta clinopodiicola]